MRFSGANERPEFIRKTALLASIWTGFGLRLKAGLIGHSAD
jgi:hypothetical protein